MSERRDYSACHSLKKKLETEKEGVVPNDFVSLQCGSELVEEQNHSV